MPLQPSSLPLLLAGPILRRVEQDLVSVWIATSRPCDVSLLLFEGEDVVAPQTTADDPRAQWRSAAQRTLVAGAHLHVLVVTLDLREPGGNATRSAGPLRADQAYSYDLALVSARAGEPPENFRSLKLLGGTAPLGFDAEELPAFRTPPEERDKLVIVHGSCRRMFDTPPLADDPANDGPFPPPGGWPTVPPTPGNPLPEHDPAVDEFPEKAYPTTPKIDGMLWVDALVDSRGALPRIASRPHQLFLTGDQIYADDVPAVLLPVLTELGRLLVGPEDLGADPGGTAFLDATLENFPPGFRHDIVARSGGFSTGDGASHLLSLGEFVAYYLLTWSPALWEMESPLWPSEFLPSNLRMPDDWRIRFLYTDDAADRLPPEALEEKETESYRALLEWIKTHPNVAGARPREHAAFYFTQLRDHYAARFWSPELFEWWTRRFRHGLPRVRRALANVPTYMVADDHEVSDDWYATRAWRDAAFTRPLGTDIIRHGLIAYTLMQAWGNDPRRWTTGAERELLDEIAKWAVSSSRRQQLTRLHELLGLPFSRPDTTPTFRPLVQYSYRVEGPCHRVLVIDGRTQRRFPIRNAQAGGIDYEGPTGIFGDSPMAAALPEPPAGDTKLTLVVTGVPVLGPEGMELALLPFQRLARLLLSVDAEAWSYEPATFEALLAALARYRHVVLLSGDIHVGFSASLDYWSAPANGMVRTAQIVQLVSSGLTQDWGRRTPVLKANALTHDIFESVTTVLSPTERVGWGEPLRTALTPPVPVGKVVELSPGRVAHPSFRSRLKMRAPVVPTHGWPTGTTETRTPNWAWRLQMVRDDREESIETPTLTRRWTPVTLVDDPVAPPALGWHAQAARRMAYGRVFAFQPNVGIVTFEQNHGAWSVRHVLAGELPPIAETGVTPAGLQPYVVHRIPLSPVPVATWDSDRPRIHDDEGWGVDRTDPALELALYWMPRIWQRAAGHVTPLWPQLPANLDDVARSELIVDAANRLAPPFRRDVVRELGPFAAMTDEELDQISGTRLAELLSQIGRFDADAEARALVRPDLERLINLYIPAADRAAFLDDVLLIAASDWVHRRYPMVSLIAGLLATFRSPVTRHVPLLAGLLAGLWDRWRNRTHLEYWTQGNAPSTVTGLLTIPPRAVEFVYELIKEVVLYIVENREPRGNGGPPIFPPELALAAGGAVLSYLAPKRMTVASGWELPDVSAAPGVRRADISKETLAKQTVSVMVHPGKRARFEAPITRLTATLIPPDTGTAPGFLFAGWDGGLRFEADIGGGFRQVVETTSGGWVQQPWRLGYVASQPAGIPGAKTTISVIRPTQLSLSGGMEIRFTPTIGFALGFTRDAAGLHPTFELRFALNDSEDRIAFTPKTDGFLAQLLPASGITIPFDATVAFDIKNGWRFVGMGELTSLLAQENPPAPSSPMAPSGSGASTITTLNRKLGVLTLHDRSIDVGFDGAGDGVTLSAKVRGTVSLNIGPVRLAVSGLGVEGRLHIAGDPLEAEDVFDTSVNATVPTGLAVSVNARVVSGGGFLQRIESATGAVSWRGGLQLRVTETFDVGAWGVVETGGGQHWSLLVFLAARFTPPRKVSQGLKLVAIGGMLALHRRMDTNALRDAAAGVQGSLDALLMPDRPEQRFLELLPVVNRFFPPAADHHVFGPMVEFEWGIGGRTNARIKAALLFEIGDFKAALYGTVHIGFPTVSDDRVARIRAGVEALYDHDAQMARFSITLTEALLFKRVSLTGGAALFIRWGERDEFAFTLGGFHPFFKPFIPQGLREPPRLGAHWKPTSLLDLNIQAYYAVTATSVQFGASAYMQAGASWGGVRGNIGFDFIVMTEPVLHFEFDLSFRVTAFLFGCDLISAGLRGTIIGPHPWRLEATIYWEVCGVDVSKDLGPYEWGDRQPAAAQPQQARQILGEQFEDASNWSIRRSTALPVSLRAGSEDAVDPRDQLDLRQTRLPLGTALEVHDGNPLSDGGSWTIAPVGTHVVKVGDLTDAFPTRRYRRKPPKETQFAGGLASGVRLAGAGWDVPLSFAVGTDEDATDDLVLDSLPTPPRRVRVPVRVALEAALVRSAPTASIDRAWTRHGIRLVEVAG